jgi:hypothetical protein
VDTERNPEFPDRLASAASTYHRRQVNEPLPAKVYASGSSEDPRQTDAHDAESATTGAYLLAPRASAGSNNAPRSAAS